METIPLRVLPLLPLLAAAIVAAPAVSQAAVYKADGCQVTVPDGWVTSKTRIATPDKKLWVELMSAPTAGEIISVETNLKATKLAEDGRMALMVSSASYGGLTNKQFHAITKTSPACLADVTVPAGAAEATGRQIAVTVGPAR